ncbi:hypothetical protein NKW84_17750 [Acetobacter senegalensis]|uniref:hypothetical protein n=1 Tax=Acetobacter senegalensis TaxID=446692 RepID=UPI00209F8C0B|nr:hypothetical protein [Acetobacter senegalensis]MCP1197672.1 hypothetical protein [Acetobacter senegalensis]
MLPTKMTALSADLDHHIKRLISSIPVAQFREEGILAADAIFYIVAASIISGQYNELTEIVPEQLPGGPTIATTQGSEPLESLSSVQVARSKWQAADGPLKLSLVDAQQEELAQIAAELPAVIWRSVAAACASILFK